MNIISQLCGGQVVRIESEVDEVILEAQQMGIQVGEMTDVLTTKQRIRITTEEAFREASIVCVASSVQNEASDAAFEQLSNMVKGLDGKLAVLAVPQEGLERAEAQADKFGFVLPVSAYGSMGLQHLEVAFRQCVGLGLTFQSPEFVVFRKLENGDFQLLGTDGAHALAGGTLNTERFPDWQTNALSSPGLKSDAQLGTTGSSGVILQPDGALAVTVSSDSAVRCGFLPGDAATLRVGPCRIPVWINRVSDQEDEDEDEEGVGPIDGSAAAAMARQAERMPSPFKVPLGRLSMSPTARRWLARDIRLRQAREAASLAAERATASDSSVNGAATESKTDDSHSSGREGARMGPAHLAASAALVAGDATFVLDRLGEVPVAECIGIRPVYEDLGPRVSKQMRMMCSQVQDQDGGGGRTGADSERSGAQSAGQQRGIPIASESMLLTSCIKPHFGLAGAAVSSDSSSIAGMTPTERVLAALTEQQGASAAASGSGAGAVSPSKSDLNLLSLQAGTMGWLTKLAGEADCKQRLVQFGCILSLPLANSGSAEAAARESTVLQFKVDSMWPRCAVATVGPDTRFELLKAE